MSDNTETVRSEILCAQRELDRATALDDQSADAIGCAENALERALAALTPSPVALDEALVDRITAAVVTWGTFPGDPSVDPEQVTALRKVIAAAAQHKGKTSP